MLPQTMPAPHLTPAYPWGDTQPATGQSVAVAPGVLWIRMGLPFALDHINLWLLRDRLPDPHQPGCWQEGWTAVDCGVDSPATRQAWLQLEQTSFDGLPLLRVLVTHMHPDHVGLAHWLCERWQAPLWMGLAEYQAARLAQAGLSSFESEVSSAFFASHGWMGSQSADATRRRGLYCQLVPELPSRFVRLTDGLQLTVGERTWTCVQGLGHSPGHMALLADDRSLFISGDMLLPSISTNVSVSAQEPDSDPLSWFLQSLDRMQGLLDPQTLILPAHGRPFRGANERLTALQSHHQERLQDLLLACREQAQSASALLPRLFRRSLDAQQQVFAMGEAVAHLHTLWHAGQVQRRRGDDGIYRFSTSPSVRAD
jgi:glyoxylase-like metal-dependent hydrolase (beta-lactamase superfamily II)